ncbi:MAG: hypothetical protein GY929_00950 [Actinomycetia bacterium]|nr:hypothetical protein [Actinomycetes bacterium]MCP5024826.1 hypothetical protein [Actinomycetes bacterium]
MTTPTIDSIPVAFTPAGGWSDWPRPILAGCNEPRPDGAPDLDGFWQTIEASIDGEVVPEHPALGGIQRIEQAGDRVIVTAAGIIHDMRCDGTLDHGVHDVAEFDMSTEIHVIANYEDGVHVLRPQGLDLGSGPIEVHRWREGEYLMWRYVGFTARLQYLASSDADPAIVLSQVEDRR